MSVSKVRRSLYRANRLLGDVNAIATGRVGQRVANRAIGKALGRMTRRLWRR